MMNNRINNHHRFRNSTTADFRQTSRTMIGSRNVEDNEFRGIDFARFKATFGVEPEVCSIVWNKMVALLNEYPPNETRYDNLHPMHMLWALFYLKMYPTARQISSVVGKVCKDNFRFWTRFVIDSIGALGDEVVSGISIKCLDLLYFITSTYFFIIVVLDFLGQSSSWRQRQRIKNHS